MNLKYAHAKILSHMLDACAGEIIKVSPMYIYCNVCVCIHCHNEASRGYACGEWHLPIYLSIHVTHTMYSAKHCRQK